MIAALLCLCGWCPVPCRALRAAPMEAVVGWATKVFQAAMRGPPKGVFNPSSHRSMDKAIKKFNEVQRAEGFGAAYNKTRMESMLRKGMDMMHILMYKLR